MRLSAEQIEAIKQETKHFSGAQAESWLYDSRVNKYQRGFTLVELIMTMVIIGIIAAVAAPRFFDANVFMERGFADEVKASLRFAQKTAIAQRKFVCVMFGANSVALTIDAVTDPSATGATPTTCTSSLSMGSVSNSSAFFTLFGGTTATTPSNIYFNALGKPYSYVTPYTTALSTTPIYVNGNAITIVQETGYVH